MADMLNREVGVDDYVVFDAPYGGLAIGQVSKLTPKGYTIVGKKVVDDREGKPRVIVEKCNRPFNQVFKIPVEVGEDALLDVKRLEIKHKLRNA